MSASSSTPWVLVRGLARERAHWGPYPAQLGAAVGDARVLTLDLPGAGMLHRQRCPTNVDAMVEACRAQLAAANLDMPVRLLGLSLGGMVVARWMALHPQEVAAAVIVNSSARDLGALHRRLRPRSLPALLGIALRWGSRAAEHAVLNLTSAQPQRHVGVLGSWTMVHQQRPVSRLNALRQLMAAARFRVGSERPSCPVLVVCSAGDALVDPRCSQRLAALWDGELAVHPQAGHDLPLDDGPWLAGRIAAWARANALPS